MCTLMFIAALLTIAKIWKQPKCLLMGEWIKMCCWVGQKIHSGFPIRAYGKTQTKFLANPIDTTECYSAIKRNEILPFVTT